MTQEQFEILYNQRRQETMTIGYYPKHFNLMKSKYKLKPVYKDEVDSIGRPSRVIATKGVSVKVFDTNKFNELCQVVWEYYLGTKLKRISSEGKWRQNGKGGGKFIRNENRGFSDLHGMHTGKAIYIETKQVKENHLDSQKEFSEWVTAGGGIYVSVRSFEDIYNVVQGIINETSLQEYMKIKQPKRRVDSKSLF